MYTRTICLSDVLPLLASRGMLLAVDYPRVLLERLRREREVVEEAVVEVEAPAAVAPVATAARVPLGRRLREGAAARAVVRVS